MLPRTPTLFPYTTLFRSVKIRHLPEGAALVLEPERRERSIVGAALGEAGAEEARVRQQIRGHEPAVAVAADRSEEHTSELQSHHDLVCRLLLEKKNLNFY